MLRIRVNVDVDDGNKDRHAYNVGDGNTDAHAYAWTWSDVVSRSMIRGKMCTRYDKHYGLKAKIEGRLGVFVWPERPIENV